MRASTPPIWAVACALLLAVAACGDGEQDAGLRVQMDFTRAGGLYSAPVPSVEIAGSEPSLAGLPGRDAIDFVAQAVELIEAETDGAGLSSGIFFTFEGPLAADASLPNVAESVTPDGLVALIDVDEMSPELGRRFPVDVRVVSDGGPFGAADMLALLPLQGFPLRPATRYAAVLRRSEALVLGVAPKLRQLLRGQQPEGLSDAAFAEYRAAIAQLTAQIPPEEIAGLTVFRTGDPTAQTRVVFEAARARPPIAPLAPPAQREVFDDFCTFSTRLRMPVFQDGEPPYNSGGGRWRFDASGAPILQREVEAELWITLPRSAPPEGGFPTAVFVRTGGGGERPLVDRGVRAEPGGDAIAAGTGPALEMARAGFAALSVDGPHGGLRNLTGGDEQFLMFNLLNPGALRDNVRQSAIEIALLAELVPALRIDASACPGLEAADVQLRGGGLALMGHSMGATIAPIAAALEPRYRALILSGAGASWIANLVHKLSPIPVKDTAELILGYARDGHTLHEHDPVVSLMQWAADSADPLSYLRTLIDEPGAAEPRHVLMLQGIVDTYIMPPIANAMSLGLGLDLAGASLDREDPQLQDFAALETQLVLRGRTTVPLPAIANRGDVPGSPVTAVVVQHGRGPVEDGHEVAFQLEAPKRQYRCFLRSFAAGGAPVVPAADEGACPLP